MLHYSALRDHPVKFLAMTGYTTTEFEALLPSFTSQFTQFVQSQTLRGQPRQQRAYTTYRNGVLPTIEDKLLFILVYLKQATTQEVHANLFGMHQPDANRWLHLLHPLLNQALANLGELPVREADALSLEAEEGALYFHDGTERPIQRPQDTQDQRLYYSGKKKQHTLKNNVIIDASCKVRFLTATCEGKKHDKRVADDVAYPIPQGSTLCQDTGFQGFSLEGVCILQPKKKPRGQSLSVKDRLTNRWISSLRIRIEHAIGGVKRYRIVKDKLRNWKTGFRDQVMETCCGLHNFRLRFRPWHYQYIII